ncbi:VanW family protein [Clostridium sp. Sa3CUN1]|uniref:VanW family protein n=1 Tax=Clostridium gallinarum TaxID=2762246 RepID=A0ABR8Q7Z3_9CLOT|nr:VanW family protein [Clostridium gallinarum]MBD7916551.1 VanW family protein [Clostridium gallinarum]
MNNNITPQTNEVNPKENNSTKKIVLITSLAIIVLIGCISGYLLSKNKKLVDSYANKVYPGIYVFDKDVSGLTKEELHTVLEEMVGNISSRKLSIAINDKSFEESYNNFDVTIDYETFENEVLSYGKDIGFFEKVNRIKKPESKTYEFSINYNEEKLVGFIDSINDAVLINPVDAKANIYGGTVNITPEQIGYELNKEDLKSKIEAVLLKVKDEDLVALDGQLVEIQPYITAAALQTVDTKISSYTTHFTAGPSGTNVLRGAQMIGSRVVMPGDEFSTVEAIGPTTAEYGFVSANTYLNGKVVPGFGGGVCQISSTIYNAELRAGIIPTYRVNHEMTVSYVPQGLDATIGDEWPDLTFENPYDYPIIVNVYAGGGSLTAEFWSNSEATGGIRYEPKAYQTGSLSADTYLYGYDSNGECVLEKYLDSSVYKPFS